MTALTIALLALIPVIVAFIVHAERRDEKRQQAREDRRRELANGYSWVEGVPRRYRVENSPRAAMFFGTAEVHRRRVDEPESAAWRDAA